MKVIVCSPFHRPRCRHSRPWKGKVYANQRCRWLSIRVIWQTFAMLWLWNRMVFVRYNIFGPLCFFTAIRLLTLIVSFFYFSFLVGFLCPLMWYYATILYFGNYYKKDPRERAGLAASAIAVSTLCSWTQLHSSFLRVLYAVRSYKCKLHYMPKFISHTVL